MNRLVWNIFLQVKSFEVSKGRDMILGEENGELKGWIKKLIFWDIILDDKMCLRLVSHPFVL